MADVDRGDVEMDDLKKFRIYVYEINNLTKKLEKLSRQKSVVRIDPPQGWVEREGWMDRLKEFMGSGIEFKSDGKSIGIPFNRARNLGYLVARGGEEITDSGGRYFVKVMGELDLLELLALYKAYEEGLLKEVMEGLERAIPELRRRESLLRKASSILEAMGVPQA